MARYAILSDIHANMEALTVVLQKCKELAVDEYVCLGDIVGYNANPAECLEMLRELEPIGIVKGNHDEQASIINEAIDNFNPDARRAVEWTFKQLDSEQRKWLKNLPYRFAVPKTNITITHATLDSPENWGYIFDAHHASDNFAYQFTQLCFCGHSHAPIAFKKKPIAAPPDISIEELAAWTGCSSAKKNKITADVIQEREEQFNVDIEVGYKYLFNVGSVGQPRNHDPRASFAVYDSDKRAVTRYCVSYDIETTQQKIIKAGLPRRLAERLALGR